DRSTAGRARGGCTPDRVAAQGGIRRIEGQRRAAPANRGALSGTRAPRADRMRPARRPREDTMQGPVIAASMLFALVALPTTVSAQTLEKKNYNYSEWTKGRFSEAVTVTGPGKLIFLAGVGAEDENGKGGDILHKGDFVAQCHYSYDKIKRLLAKHGATLADVAKMVTYMTDVRYQPDYG